MPTTPSRNGLVVRYRAGHVGRLSAVAFVIGLLAILGFPAMVSAEPPSRLPGQITDNVSALDAGARADLQSAIDDLYSVDKVRLWVVYVADFSGQEPQTWGAREAELSSLGDRDVLLSVAITDLAYDYSVPDGLNNVTQKRVDDIRVNSIEPALRSGDWSAAGIAAATGISDAMNSSSGSGVNTTTLLVGGGAVVVAGGGVALYSRKKRSDRQKQNTAAAREVDPSDTASLARLPVDALDIRAREMLVEMDNAIRTSGEELELARGEFGDNAATPFIIAVENAKTTLAQAFTIRQRLDDDVPETPDQRRDMLVQLISTCGKADDELDAQVAEFDGMRNLLIDAPARFDALTQDMVGLTVRVPQSQTTLTQLNFEFPAAALAPVADNVSMAQERLSFAEQNIQAGREATQKPAGEQGPAVASIRAAEGAIGQARTLLDAVDHAAVDIRNAIAALPAALDDARNDIATAEQLAPYGDAGLAQAKLAANQAVSRAEAAQKDNPLGAFNDITAADVELDKALAAATDRKEQSERLAQQVDQALTSASAQVTAAADFISTRRGAVNAEARTRLSEAQRHLDQAQSLRSSDPSQALDHARAAGDLGARALNAAQSDVQQWQDSQRSTSYGGGSQAGAVLGGILIDSMLRGGRGGFGGGLGGGFGGGRGPGSFGGSRSSGRIGGGGRF